METTTNLIGNARLRLLRNPEAAVEICASRLNLSTAMIEEVLAFLMGRTNVLVRVVAKDHETSRP